MFQRLITILLTTSLALTLLSGCSSQSKTAAEPTVELTISAAASLKDALTDIQQDFEKHHPQIKLTYNFGASGALQKQIEQGAPADIFISAAPKQMNELAGKNLINKNTRVDLLENKLVVIIPQNSSLPVNRFEDLTNQAIEKISIGEPGSVPAGQYAQEVFKKLALTDALQRKLVLAKDVRTVLTYVETGNVEAGIVYKTDAAISDKVKIVCTAPSGSHQPIIYPAALLSSSKHASEAQVFLSYLQTKETQRVFEKYGFAVIAH